jgi:CRISPR-associated protein Cas2
MKSLAWFEGWWEEAFPQTRTASEIAGHPKGRSEMKVVVAYDITNAKRLKKIADICLGFGIRIQYSIFECRLNQEQFDLLWSRLCSVAKPEEDRLVAYPIYAREDRQTRTFGQMVTNDAVVAYVF